MFSAYLRLLICAFITMYYVYGAKHSLLHFCLWGSVGIHGGCAVRDEYFRGFSLFVCVLFWIRFSLHGWCSRVYKIVCWQFFVRPLLVVLESSFLFWFLCLGWMVMNGFEVIDHHVLVFIFPCNIICIRTIYIHMSVCCKHIAWHYIALEHVALLTCVHTDIDTHACR